MKLLIILVFLILVVLVWPSLERAMLTHQCLQEHDLRSCLRLQELGVK